MRHAVLAILVLAGCSFDHGYAADSSGALADASTAAAQACHSSLPGLRLCMDFEATGFTADHSGLANPVQVTGVTPMTRGTQGAAMTTASSVIEVDDTPNLMLSPAATLEMWVRPSAYPADGSYAYFVSRSGAYHLGLYGDRVSCDVESFFTDIYAIATKPLPLDTWSHVACVYDGKRVAVYVGGAVAGCWSEPLVIATFPTTTELAHAYAGGIDDVHVYAGALADADVCQLATGGTQCGTACPP